MIRRRDCPACQKQVVADHVAPNNVVHFLLSLITAGAWIVPWLLITLFADDFPCPWCGASTTQPKDEPVDDRVALIALAFALSCAALFAALVKRR